MNLPAIHHCDCDVCVLRFNLCFFCDSPSAQELPPWGVSSLSIHRYRLRGFQPWEIGGLGFQLNCVLRAQCLMLQLLDKESCSNSAGFMGSFFFVNPWFDDSMAQFWWAIFVVLKVGLVWSSILRTHLLSPWVLWTLSGIRLSPVLVRRVRRASGIPCTQICQADNQWSVPAPQSYEKLSFANKLMCLVSFQCF